MILNVIFRSKTNSKVLILLFILSTNLFAFNTIIKDTFSQNKDLISYEKKLQIYNSKRDIDPLENTLIRGFNYDKKLKILIFKKQNYITSKNITLYLKVLKNKAILNIYKENDKNYIKKRINTKDINNLQNMTKSILLKQTKILKESLKEFKNYTNHNYKKTKLEKIINNYALPLSFIQAYNKFLSLEEYKKEAIFIAINANKKSQVLEHLNKQYLKQNYLVNEIKVKKYELKELNQIKLPKDYLKFLKHKNKIINLKANIISIRYNILFNKSKILYFIGTLMSDINLNIKKIPNIHLNKIHFAGNSISISPYSANIIAKHAKKLLK